MRELNVFTYSFCPWKYPSNWWKNLRQCARNFKWAWQRATRGYCNFDLWDLDTFYVQLFGDSLIDFQKDLHGAPSEFYDEENDSIEDWQNYIKEMAVHFLRSREDDDFFQNEYEDAALNGMYFEDGQLKHQDEGLNDKWFAREKEIAESRQQEFDKGWNMMHDVFHHLWD